MIQGLLTFDVETWFSITDFAPFIDQESAYLPLRLEQPIDLLLEILSDGKAKATFFWVGKLALKEPRLVRKISKEGHEIACHSYSHQLLYGLSNKEIHREIVDAKHMIEDIVGTEIIGFRAPSFSLTRQAVPFLLKAGYKYDSSLWVGKGELLKELDEADIQEFPVSTRRIMNKRIPFGGGYLRLFKLDFYLPIFNKNSEPVVVYLHPWEFDPYHPRVRSSPMWIRFKHYNGLRQSKSILSSLLFKAQWEACISIIDK